jgi:tetratricopeptide (TPR) repeat protein
MGEIYLFKGEYKTARDFYSKFLNNYKGKNFIKDTYYKIFLTYWQINDEANAKVYLNKILKSGQVIYDTDKHAQKFAEKGEMPNRILMRSRLYFDGGYFHQALETINTFNVKDSQNQKDNLEFYYRKGRIYHQLNNYSNASLYYLKTIEISPNSNYYFAPNAALQMGYIYKDQGNKELARIYFQKALSYQNYEYKNSIDNKAKGALNEMKKK